MATSEGTTRKRSTQPSTSSTCLQMPQIPVYPAIVRKIYNLTDVELMVLCDARRLDGLSLKGRSALERQTMLRLAERDFLNDDNVAKLWRLTGIGECCAKVAGGEVCDWESPSDTRGAQRSLSTAKVLPFANPHSHTSDEARR